MKAALQLIYPPQCLACGMSVANDGSLCPTCWRDCEFVSGCCCHLCGVPLPGIADAAELLTCDDCLTTARPWVSARAALVYRGVGRNLAMALKHGDRPDLAKPLGTWLAQAAAGIVVRDMAVVPVPIHPLRLMSRKYNQAALLSAQLARWHDIEHIADALRRERQTDSQGRKNLAARVENLRGAMSVHPARKRRISGRPVLLVDDVMASGATLSAAATALEMAGCGPVSVAVLARAVKD